MQYVCYHSTIVAIVCVYKLYNKHLYDPALYSAAVIYTDYSLSVKRDLPTFVVL